MEILNQIGIIVTILINAVALAYGYGTLNQRVKELDRNIDELKKHEGPIIRLGEAVSHLSLSVAKVEQSIADNSHLKGIFENLHETVSGLQQTLRNGFSNRMIVLEKEVSAINARCKALHKEIEERES